MFAFNEVRDALELLGYDYDEIIPALKVYRCEARYPDMILAIAVCNLESERSKCGS